MKNFAAILWIATLAALLGFLAPAKAQEPEIPNGVDLPGQTRRQSERPRDRRTETYRQDYSRSGMGVGVSSKIGGQRVNVRWNSERGSSKTRVPRRDNGGYYPDSYSGYTSDEVYEEYLRTGQKPRNAGSRDYYGPGPKYFREDGRVVPSR